MFFKKFRDTLENLSQHTGCEPLLWRNNFYELSRYSYKGHASLYNQLIILNQLSSYSNSFLTDYFFLQIMNFFSGSQVAQFKKHAELDIVDFNCNAECSIRQLELNISK